MDASLPLHVLESAERDFDKLTENPEIYVEPQPEKAECFKHLSKSLYNFAVRVNKNRKGKGKFLSKLLIDGFDDEQIWHQCDLLNAAILSNISQAVQGINSQDLYHAVSRTKRVLPTSSHTGNDIASENDDAISDSESDAQGEYAFDDDSDSEMEFLSKSKITGDNKIVSDCSEVEENDSISPLKVEAPSRNKLPGKQKKVSNPSEVDDKFFKLSELEQFLKIEDLKEERGIEENSDHDDDIDLFQDIPSDDMDDSDEEEEDEGEKPLKSSKDLMYEDFFDNPDAEVEYDNDSDDVDDDDDEEEAESMTEAESDKASLDGNDADVNMQDDLEMGDDSEGLNKLENKNVPKTAFELEQEKIRKKIQEYEKSMIEPLPWHLTGEVDASRRPIDSLIHKETDFDSNVKEDLIIDNDLTESIEEIVKMAIRNKAFNDVEKKYKLTEDVTAFKTKAALDQTKSKKSLAEVYEDEYLKKQSKQEEGEDPKHKEIKKLMDSLFPELYALFTHIPVPAIPELKVVSNLPAVTVEEVAPVTLNDATLLAPEEVKEKTGQIKSKTERTDTDRKRERRKKKVHQKLKEKKRLEKLESQKGNPSAKVTKLEKLQTLKKLKQHRNTKLASVDDSGKIKSSKDFFTRLQDTVDSKDKSKTQKSPKKRLK